MKLWTGHVLDVLPTLPEKSDEPVTVWRGEFPCRVLGEGRQ